ncbi:MAG: phenylalanine--tRNA ligase subunit beta [Candidatus Levybacteria bacterium]|nr:phenylalanine--tRNA ligase subunit beta [Candidatus Levybacteria bacterium]
MNIKILDSWLKEYLKTKATAKDIAKYMSLSSVSIERIEQHNDDRLYDIEVTTNRPDLMSVVGLAREAGAVLPQSGIDAAFLPPTIEKKQKTKEDLPLKIINDNSLVYRVCAVVMDVTIKKSSPTITERLEASDIRSLNNVIDITNYVMRTIGHPAHVFDYDRIAGHTLKIRESIRGEMITTLDNKSYTLPGGDIIAEDGDGNIVDLLGIMGLENSVVTDDTKRIIFFINNNNPHKIRKTSMGLGIRTEAAQMNEKMIDAELAMDALLFGIDSYKEHADAKIVSEIFDIYPKPYKTKRVSVKLAHIQQVIGIPLPLKEAESTLKKLGFGVEISDEVITASVPSFRASDIDIPEDLIEEIARVYGYHNLPSILPPANFIEPVNFGANKFYWEQRVKNSMKYWGFDEVYTYPMVSESMYEAPSSEAVRLANPLGEDFVYMRTTLVPSLLKVMQQNTKAKEMRVFEIANVYYKSENTLPNEKKVFAGLIKKPHVSFFEIKGLIEQVALDLGIPKITCSSLDSSGLETSILLDKKSLGTIEILDEDLINFELNFETLVSHATLHKTYTPIAKHPPIVEDISVIIDDSVTSETIIKTIKETDRLVTSVTLLDRYQDTRTFHITYQDPEKNLTSKDVSEVRAAIIESLTKNFQAVIK